MRRIEPGLRNASRGTALILAMIVVMLATGAAVAMASRQQLELRRLENTTLYDQALLQVGGIELWAFGVTSSLTTTRTFLSQSLMNNLAFNEKVDDGDLSATIVDVEGRFNLNNLIKDGEVSEVDLDRFERLLAIMQIDPNVADSVLDWMDPDVSPRPGGAEDDYYSRLTPPYRAANQAFASMEELRGVRYVTPEIYQRLRLVVVVLPGHTDINVNSAPPEVIQCLLPDVDSQAVQSIVSRQKGGGFETIDDFLNMLPKQDNHLNQTGLTVQSNFFEVRGEINLGRLHLASDSIVYSGTGTPPRVILRHFGEFGNG